ncbi:MAG TPA: DUF2804 domain-containing protein [Polyangia bacterium]|jgi:hypothetical protein
MRTLPPAPATPVDGSGYPRFGTFAGPVGRVTWDGLAAPFARGHLYRRTHLKRWHYVGIAGPSCVVACAIIDLGYAASAFAYAFDRDRRELLADRSWMGLPVVAATVADRAGAGARSRFVAPGVLLELGRPADASRWLVQIQAGDFTLQAVLDAAAAPPTVCAIAPIDGGVANCTHKTVCLPATGTLRAGRASLNLAGSFGALDHTTGLLARDTRWRWACAWGRGIGLNLVEGFNGPAENALWLGDELVPVGAAVIGHAEDAMAPWTVRTDDGLVDLTFTPEGMRRENKDLLVAASRYVQPIGRFNGHVRRAPGAPAVTVRDLCGVTEDHAARW